MYYWCMLSHVDWRCSERGESTVCSVKLVGVSSVSMLLCVFGCGLLVHLVAFLCNGHGVLLLVYCPEHSILRFAVLRL